MNNLSISFSKPSIAYPSVGEVVVIDCFINIDINFDKAFVKQVGTTS
jgi:hypothetical protein